MNTSLSNWPMILIVDNDLARVEYLENLLYQHGYQSSTVTTSELKSSGQGIEKGLVLAYVPLGIDEIASQGLPVISLASEVIPGPEETILNDPPVMYLARSTCWDVLIERIAGLLVSGKSQK